MFDKWFNLPAHLYLRLTALTLLTVGVALSNVLMSIGAIWIIANWLIEADFKAYKQRFLAKKTIWIVVSIFLFLAISLFWSGDIQYGFKDLRVKLPFIAVPLVMATSKPLEKKHFYFLLYVFIGIIVYTSGYNYIRYNYVLNNANDIREMSTFISHVRYAMLVNFAIFISVYLALKRKLKPFVVVPIVLWLLFYLYKSQVINGYLLFLIMSLLTILYAIKSIKARGLKIGLFAGVILGVLAVGVSFYQLFQSVKTCKEFVYEDLEEFTALGNPYFHDTSIHMMENGNLVWLYVSQEEMEEAWDKRSSFKYHDLDKKEQPIFGTLMRYLTSKNLRKDAEGVNQLSLKDIEQIENGRTSVAVNSGLKSRLQAFSLELAIYEDGGDPNGNSLIQRIEHVKAAIGILNSKWLTGVGVGDVPLAFEEEYLHMNSRLDKEHRHRSHNQFLTIWVSLGVFGFVLYVLLLVMPFFEIKLDYFGLIVIVALILGSLFQDFIETQAGVTIFALFYSLALYREKEEV